MTDNFKTPEATLIHSSSGSAANRWDRLVAQLVDGIVLSVIVLPIVLLTGLISLDEIAAGKSSSAFAIMNFVYVFSFLVINGYFLFKDGQTVGKKALGIKIVNMEGSKASTVKNIMPRYVFFFACGMVPVVGPILNIANLLFIFRRNKRCIHDLVARTMVVDC